MRGLSNNQRALLFEGLSSDVLANKKSDELLDLYVRGAIKFFPHPGGVFTISVSQNNFDAQRAIYLLRIDNAIRGVESSE
jgi:hypothetical protein